ncbi:DUF2905 domain-containing protein [Bacteroidota bacterium]
MQKTLIIIGVMILLVGIFWPWISKLPFFKLPGDIVLDKPGLKVFIPITTMILISVIVSVIIYLIRKFL